jgi:lysophospholipase L1-like esterase
MASIHKLTSRVPGLRALLFFLIPCWISASAAEHWVGTWSTALMTEPAAKESLPFAGASLRQVVHVSLGGARFRLTISNAFGATALTIHGVHVALATGPGAIRPESDRAVRFDGQASIVVPPGADLLSDPVELALPPLGDLAITILLQDVPSVLTLHPGARATSYLQAGDALAAPAFTAGGKTFTRWYFIAGLEVDAPAAASASVMLGDSITDGHGCGDDRNERWPDELARRLQTEPGGSRLGVLNAGIGGNRLLRDGLGPNVLARFSRDVLAQPGVRSVLVFEGINDIGTRLKAQKQGAPFASAADIIGALQQVIDRAHSAGLRVIGATITPYAGADFYWTADGEADRRAVNEWIRTSGRFDAVVDFDAAVRDPASPSRLAPAYDGGDHLHPSVAGYKHMAEMVDLHLFTP